MGLGFCIKGSKAEVEAQWSCSGFNRFRERLAMIVGIELKAMFGFGGRNSWEEFKDEPLVPLLHHSDCDGELTSAQCARVAPRLREILKNKEFVEDSYQHDLRNGLGLAEAMEEAVRLKKPLVFC